MDSNPVMERMFRLSEQWRSVLTDEPDLRMVCWGGSSLSEYRMIMGFVLFHTSEESTLDDIFVLCGQPFDGTTAPYYGKLTGELMNSYVQAWNRDEELVAQGGRIDWTYQCKEGREEGKRERAGDLADFVENVNKLAESLFPGKPEEREETVHLVMVILPNELRDFEVYREWVTNLLSADISPKVRFMLYDRTDAPLLDGVQRRFATTFKHLIPDMDLHGAACEVLEQARQEEESEEGKDAIAFERHLLRLSDAIAKNKGGKATKHRDEALRIAEHYEWYDLCAVVHYLTFSLYYARKEYKTAETEIDQALAYIRVAMEKERQAHLLNYCQYLGGKAMLLLMQTQYEKAARIYGEGVAAATELGDRILVIGLHQMHGFCLRKMNEAKRAWRSFVTGWEMVEAAVPEDLQGNIMYKFYAMEMLKTNAPMGELVKYIRRFDELWGKEWKERVEDEMKKNKREYKIFDR